MKFKNARLGFTFVETLACVAIASVLAGIALPVLGDATEEARQRACANRLAEITLGSLQYQEANEQMPPLVTGDGPVPSVGNLSATNDQNTGALAYVLPFIGEQELFDLMPAIATQPDMFLVPGAAFSSFTQLLNDPEMLLALESQIPSMICPSDADLLDRPLDLLFYGMIQVTDTPGTLFLSFFNITNTLPTAFGRTSYLPSTGGFHAQFESETRGIDLSINDTAGAMRNRLLSIPTSELGDGASNTVCWSESLGHETENGVIVDAEITGASFGLLSTALVTGSTWGIGDGEGILFGDSANTFSFLIGSNHVNGNNVTFCDGSVRFISDRTSRGVMTALGCGNDGWVAERSQ